jgi:predicted  nucleic acid-binding Zn-ribbon protein
METVHAEEVDSLSRLEERIQKTAELVTRLRRERDAALAQSAAVAKELETLRGERVQVRSRIEKLLGQMETLGSS